MGFKSKELTINSPLDDVDKFDPIEVSGQEQHANDG